LTRNNNIMNDEDGGFMDNIIPGVESAVLFDPAGERCLMVAAHGSHCRVRYDDGEEDRFRIEDMDHPYGVKGLTECVTLVCMREIIALMEDPPT
jgi:hypothetical protein